MYGFIKFWLLFLKFLEKTRFSQVVATGQDIVCIKVLNFLRWNIAFVPYIVQRNKTQASLLGYMLERWSNVIILLTSSRTEFLIATHQTGSLKVSSRHLLSGSRTPETMTARWQSIMGDAEKHCDKVKITILISVWVIFSRTTFLRDS